MNTNPYKEETSAAAVATTLDISTKTPIEKIVLTAKDHGKTSFPSVTTGIENACISLELALANSPKGSITVDQDVIDRVRHDAASSSIAGWDTLSNLAPIIRLPSGMIKDVVVCRDVYKHIRQGVEHDVIRPVDGLEMLITRNPNADSLSEIGPKTSTGGKAWMYNPEYMDLYRRGWGNIGFGPMGPLITYGILFGTVIANPEDIVNVDSVNLLGSVDYDLDRDEGHHGGFLYAMAVADRYGKEIGTKMQGTIFAALINYDIQVFVRPIQEKWVEGNGGASNLGPADISPEDWVALTIGDCAILCPAAYQDSSLYERSRAGLFIGTVISNSHDFLFDRACSNRMSAVMYASAAGVAQYSVHCAFSTSAMDALIQRVGRDGTVIYGDVAGVATAAWAPFNTRYRSWQRLVKYTRLLSRSSSSEAAKLLASSRRDVVLSGFDVNDISGSWARAMAVGAENLVRDRITTSYMPAPTTELLDIPGMVPPDLCSSCTLLFSAAITTVDGFCTIDGLSDAVVSSRSVALAAGIRRACLAACEKEFCDACASRVGIWADYASYLVLTALMTSAYKLTPAEWVTECYTVGAVTVSPVSIMTILSRFDLMCGLKLGEDDSMGIRDVIDF
ncbi:hypothetical protein BDP27DRAFT_1434472 [Rhodocollybia butyracea]|uniref:Uncharacterized protein n=1 Tax=Rhodocollybia butyracea TaxID=206335 RepID=A0A9P5P5W0_9AGAR|nr:hypothetical protein BDP27DRAFT_1434472 [Rhodocollybia butyracea]